MPRFFVALAHTDNIACFTGMNGDETSRITNLNLFPQRLKENVLFSLSFNSHIHYSTLGQPLDPVALTLPNAHRSASPKRVFADCGAFQFRDLERPLLDGKELNADVAWGYYDRAHLKQSHEWDEILLCSPDHIVTADMSDEQASIRFEFIRENAPLFLEKCDSDSRIHAIGVIHGRTIEERIAQYEMFKSMEYEYVALGGMVPYASNVNQVLDIVAGIKDLDNPVIARESVLGRCKLDGIKLHVFGLNSPEWVRWWHRLKIDSFDGSKLSTEGAANGWYYVPNDGQGQGRDYPKRPTSVADLYHRIAVKKMAATSWKWREKPKPEQSIWDIRYREELELPHYQELLVSGENVIVNGIQTHCACPACRYLRSARCTSQRCWKSKETTEHYHAADPRMMGSTEHNMGRVAHNAFVFSWIIEQIEKLNQLADESHISSFNSWLSNWQTVKIKPLNHVLIQCSKQKSIQPQSNLVWEAAKRLEDWNTAWQSSSTEEKASKLYLGRSIKNEIELINSTQDAQGYIISAGAGLVGFCETIPSYEATFNQGHGPMPEQWRNLPHGGLENLKVGEHDQIVSFASPTYHRALKHDPRFPELASKFVVASTSPLASNPNVTAIQVHPRLSELLKIADLDLNSELLRLYLKGGQDLIEQLNKECDELPPREEKPSVSDEELEELVKSLSSISNITKVVAHLRHCVGISASYERIRETVMKVRLARN